MKQKHGIDAVVSAAVRSTWPLLTHKRGRKQASERIMLSACGAPMAPCDNKDLSSRLAHSGELADELRLVRHVLATFHGPDEIKLSISEGLM